MTNILKWMEHLQFLPPPIQIQSQSKETELMQYWVCAKYCKSDSTVNPTNHCRNYQYRYTDKTHSDTLKCNDMSWNGNWGLDFDIKTQKILKTWTSGYSYILIIQDNLREMHVGFTHTYTLQNLHTYRQNCACKRFIFCFARAQF